MSASARSVLDRVDRTAVFVRMGIEDTGIGIAADRILDRLFKSFSQVDSSTTRHWKYGGTGLGPS